jgi:hypothetical protein
MMPNTKRKVALLFGLLGLAIFSVSMITVFCVPRWFEISQNWDGGRWSESQTLPFHSGEVVEYDDKLFIFYSTVTKDTINEDDAIGPGEYQLWDIFYRTYDGLNYSKEVPLTSPTDEVGVHADFVVHADKLYAVLREEWISNYTSYEWTSRVSSL